MYHFFGMHDSTLFLTQVKFYPCTPHTTSIQKELKWLKYGRVGKNLRNLNYKETLNRLFMLKKSEIIHF